MYFKCTFETSKYYPLPEISFTFLVHIIKYYTSSYPCRTSNFESWFMN